MRSDLTPTPNLRTRLAAGLGAATLLLSVPGAAMANHQESHQANFGNLVSALNNINVQIDELTALNDLTIQDVQLVNVEDVLNDSLNRNEVLNNSLNRNDVDVNVLRDFLNNSLNDNVVIVNDVLDIGDVDVADVLAINVLDNGTVVVFYQD